MARLEGKTAFVTAAAAGIGRASAIAFANEGARVIAADIDEGGLDRLKGDCDGIETIELDVMNRTSIQDCASIFSTADILMNVAGWVASGSILECSKEDWDRSMAINVTSMYETCRAFLPAMLTRKSGSIINVSSVVSSVSASAATPFVPGPSTHHRCMTGSPPPVTSKKAMADFKARQPMRRLGTPNELANLAIYLASDESGFTTGTTNMIDGGWST